MGICRKGKIRGWVLILILAAAGLFQTGCGGGNTPENESSAGQLPISPRPAETSITVTLYFSDGQAMFLLPEKREAVKKDETVEEVVVKELIKGPRDPALRRTLPPETKLLSLSIVNGVAYVNFSGELRNSQWGGSTGESLLVFSVVNSLSELPGITGVQFLVEGNKLETLFGHIGTLEPLGPDWNMVKGGKVKLGPVAVDFKKAREQQTSADNGHQPWRLDPVRVAMEDGRLLGFDAGGDTFKLAANSPEGTGPGTGEAAVEVLHNHKAYVIELFQPVKRGSAGVWTITSVRQK